MFHSLINAHKLSAPLVSIYNILNIYLFWKLCIIILAIGNIRKVRVPPYALFIKECRGNRIYRIELKFTRVISLFIMHKSLSDKEKKGH